MTAEQLTAQLAVVRTSYCTIGLPLDPFEGEGDCPECGEIVSVTLTPLDDETATAECDQCGFQFRQDI